jgi:hypothetical protein
MTRLIIAAGKPDQLVGKVQQVMEDQESLEPRGLWIDSLAQLSVIPPPEDG